MTIRRLSRASIAAGLLAWSAAAAGQAQYIAADQLMGWCDGPMMGEPGADDVAYSTCVAYLVGVSDASEEWADAGHMAHRICIAPGIQVEELRQVFLAYMRAHPDEWHHAASGLVLGAFLDEFPCEAQGGG